MRRLSLSVRVGLVAGLALLFGCELHSVDSDRPEAREPRFRVELESGPHGPQVHIEWQGFPGEGVQVMRSEFHYPNFAEQVLSMTLFNQEPLKPKFDDYKRLNAEPLDPRQGVYLDPSVQTTTEDDLAAQKQYRRPGRYRYFIQDLTGQFHVEPVTVIVPLLPE